MESKKVVTNLFDQNKFDVEALQIATEPRGQEVIFYF